jgi:hypothetical protein
MPCGRTKAKEAMAFWRLVLPNFIDRLGYGRRHGLASTQRLQNSQDLSLNWTSYCRRHPHLRRVSDAATGTARLYQEGFHIHLRLADRYGNDSPLCLVVPNGEVRIIAEKWATLRPLLLVERRALRSWASSLLLRAPILRNFVRQFAPSCGIAQAAFALGRRF